MRFVRTNYLLTITYSPNPHSISIDSANPKLSHFLLVQVQSRYAKRRAKPFLSCYPGLLNHFPFNPSQVSIFALCF